MKSEVSGFSGAYVPPMEKICIFCKQKCDGWFKFCPNCGMKFEGRVCSLPDGRDFK